MKKTIASFLLLISFVLSAFAQIRPNQMTTNTWEKVGASPHVYNVLAYGAYGDCVMLPYANMTAASATLTSTNASFVAGDVGKNVEVVGAGGSNTNLSATILSINNSTSIVLSASAVASVTNKQAYYGHDDSGVVNGLVTSLSTSNFDWAILFPSGRGYFMDGPWRKPPGSTNLYDWVQITIPEIGLTGNQRSCTFTGETPPSPQAGGTFAAGTYTFNGATLVCAKSPPYGQTNSLNVAIIGTPLPTTNEINFTWTRVNIYNLVFRTFDNPTISAVNVNGDVMYDIEHNIADTGMDYSHATQPSNVTYAFAVSANNSRPSSMIRDCTGAGYYTQYKLHEVASADVLTAAYGNNGFEIGELTHALLVGYTWLSYVRTGIVVTASSTAVVHWSVFDYEQQNGGDPNVPAWMYTQMDLSDPGGKLNGYLGYRLTEGGGGAPTAWNGAGGFLYLNDLSSGTFVGDTSYAVVNRSKLLVTGGSGSDTLGSGTFLQLQSTGGASSQFQINASGGLDIFGLHSPTWTPWLTIGDSDRTSGNNGVTINGIPSFYNITTNAATSAGAGVLPVYINGVKRYILFQ